MNEETITRSISLTNDQIQHIISEIKCGKAVSFSEYIRQSLEIRWFCIDYIDFLNNKPRTSHE